MDADKLNEAAEKAATIQYRNLSDPDVSQDGRTEAMFASMFEQGAQWLMTLPLSDRLNDEEKAELMADFNRCKLLANKDYRDGRIVTYANIFGKELFNEK